MEKMKTFSIRVSKDTIKHIKNYKKWGKLFRSQAHLVEVAIDDLMSNLNEKN